MAVPKETNSNSRYKFKDLRVYSSTEWLADNKKKYRQVFDRHETGHVYAELSFHNKLYDQVDWEATIELKCYSVRRTKKQLCHLQFKKSIKRYDPIGYIREGWGNKTPGAFWKKGTYYWEAYMDGELVGTKYFYIEDGGKDFRRKKNPFLTIESLRLYEGPFDDLEEEEREYGKSFKQDDTRYIYAEITLRNKYPGKSWQCELFTKFYNDAKELKGQVVRLQQITDKDELITITAGWGTNVRGSWRKDKYTCEIVFMDKLLAIMPFAVGDKYESGINSVYMPDKSAPMVFMPQEELQATFEEVMGRLDALVGLSPIKAQIHDHSQYIKFLQIRKERGFKEEDEVSLHSVFIGNPGTGKTTVARMIGRLYQKMGLLSKGHVHEVDRVDLIGEYIGQTAPKVKAAIEKSKGGVLFIDEAYSLIRSPEDTKDFGREVIEILVKEMSTNRGDFAVIVAGYPKEMGQFMDSNPGLKSRFKQVYEFEDYLPQQLILIAEYACQEKGVKLTDEARAKVYEMIVDAFRNRDRTFGNARFVHDVIEKAKVKMGLRVMALDNPRELPPLILETIELSDVEKINFKYSRETPEIPVDESLLQEALDELHGMIGMSKVKEQINELVSLVRFYRESGKDVLNNFFLHTVFIGNPGTGKTTVARILTKIYRALGMLERGHMIETDRQGLVAGFVGQTAIKTAGKIDESKGGVLFIDEAYALTQKQRGEADFGDEAIQTLLKRMEDRRGEFFVFVAGYPDNMEAFLKANPGLNSRFDKILNFEDYEPQELLEIAMLMLREKDIQPTEEAKEYLLTYLSFLHEYRDKYFGNARTVRQVVDEVVKQQNLRLAALPLEERMEGAINVLILQDVQHFRLDTDDFVFNKKTIGFRKRQNG